MKTKHDKEVSLKLNRLYASRHCMVEGGYITPEEFCEEILDAISGDIIKADQIARMGAFLDISKPITYNNTHLNLNPMVIDMSNEPAPTQEQIQRDYDIRVATGREVGPPLSEEEEILFQTLQDEDEDDVYSFDCPKCDAATGFGGDPDEEGDLVITCDSCGFEDQVMNFKHVKTDT